MPDLMVAKLAAVVRKADIACRRLAELSRSVTRHHWRVWQARCPTGQTRQLSPGLRDAQQRYDAVIGTRPPNAPGRARLPLVTRFLPPHPGCQGTRSQAPSILPPMTSGQDTGAGPPPDRGQRKPRSFAHQDARGHLTHLIRARVKAGSAGQGSSPLPVEALATTDPFCRWTTMTDVSMRRWVGRGHRGMVRFERITSGSVRLERGRVVIANKRRVVRRDGRVRRYSHSVTATRAGNPAIMLGCGAVEHK